MSIGKPGSKIRLYRSTEHEMHHRVGMAGSGKIKLVTIMDTCRPKDLGRLASRRKGNGIIFHPMNQEHVREKVVHYHYVGRIGFRKGRQKVVQSMSRRIFTKAFSRISIGCFHRRQFCGGETPSVSVQEVKPWVTLARDIAVNTYLPRPWRLRSQNDD